MLAQHAKAAARRWVLAEARALAGYDGAFFHGSSNWLADDENLATTSDVDVMVVLDDLDPPNKPGKLLFDGVVLDVGYIGRHALASAEQVLETSHLAGSFAAPSVIDDPSGLLAPLQREVSAAYAERRWVRRRCEHAVGKIRNNLGALDAAAPYHQQALAWLFGTGVTTHVLLVAGLRNPTVRRRYVAVRELLAGYDMAASYPRLLELLGCADMSSRRVTEHLQALSELFDVAKTVIRTQFAFAADISDLARPIAIDGSRELIERGLHREAVFWIAVTFSRCMGVLYHDAPARRAGFEPDFRRLMGDLGVASFADFQRRAGQVEQALPELWSEAEAIMARNPAIRT